MDKGFLNALKESMQIQREQIERNIEAEKPLNVTICFYHFLCDLFAIRENIGKNDNPLKDKNEFVEEFRCLKDCYNRLKHETKESLLNMTNMICSKKYPYRYPYTYGKSYFRFKSFKIFEEDLRKKLGTNREKEVKMIIERFDRVLQGKNLLEIVKQAEEITVKDINQQENVNG